MLRGVNSLGRVRHNFFTGRSARRLVRGRRWNHAPQNNARGFTLLEMMIVISIIIILMAIAIPNYNRTVIQSRESVLRSNLSTLRSVISQYTLDKQKAPQSLEDLVTAGYFKAIPTDPMTGHNDSWTVEEESDTIMTVDQKEPGIFDVHSGSSAVGSDGTAYNTW